MELTEEMAREYEKDWRAATVRSRHLAEVVHLARRLEANRAQYASIAREFSMPWEVVAVLDAMESTGHCNAHLHNGDPLSARTYHVPKGRPPKGTPPFTWEESARDALELDGARKVARWDVPGALYFLEKFNGFGYRSKDVCRRNPGIRTPYLWSFTNMYRCGKFVADGRYSQTAVSRQCGAVPLLKALGFHSQE